MKAIKLLFFSMLCLMAVAGQAQRIAVVGFKAGANVSLADIDGISETFSTYFQPKGYTPVDRLYIDKALAEQRIQRSSITEEQAVDAGRYMNVSKIVVGKVYISFDGGYQVDVIVLDVESGLRVATDGITVAKGSYRQNIQTLATRLAGKIAITPGSTVQPTPSATTLRKRSTVEILYGYLKIYPVEIGVFQAEPTSVIRHINEQAQYGYNNWRIPTNEELSLMRANNYLGSGEYMTKESKHGIVLLVSDGKDYATIQAEKEARQKAEEAKRRAEQERIARLKAQGWIDLGLPSGTLWKNSNEWNSSDDQGYYTYEAAVRAFGNSLPTKKQLEELKSRCTWTWDSSKKGYYVKGTNGESIFLPAAGGRDCGGLVYGVGACGGYWSSTPSGSEGAWGLSLDSSEVGMSGYSRCIGLSVRLVQGQ